MIGEPLPPGLQWYNPFTSNIVEINVQEHKWEGTESCFTADTQNVKVSYALTAYPDQAKIGELFRQFGLEWDKKVVPQVIQSSIKDIIGQYKADDLVSKRETAREVAFKELAEALAKRMVIATRLDFTDLNFNDDYEKAVEAKVVAVQHAAEAKNKTVQVKEEAEQKVLAAKADAESMRIKSQALSQNKGLVGYEAIQKWNGVLPTYMFGNTVPMLNLEALKKE